MSNITTILSSIGQATYVWDIETKKLDWSENFQKLVGLKTDAHLSDGYAFEKLLSKDSQETRFSAIEAAQEKPYNEAGHIYQCIYALSDEFLDGTETVWLEDTGRVYTDEHCKPVRAEGIVRIINERRKREENLVRKSKYDDLTGLPNRSHLQSRLEQTIKTSMVDHKSAAFMIISLNDFDRINAVYGFTMGDEILSQVAEILASKMRNGDMVARFSGAKFAIILNNCTAEEVNVAAKRALDSVNNKILSTERGPVSIKAAIGACVVPRHARSVVNTISAATEALDMARTKYGYKIHVYEPDPDLAEKRSKDSTLLISFIKALENGEMHLAYQPVVNAEMQTVEYHEALLRMDKRDAGIIEDASFISLSEDLGLIRLVDLRALELAMQTLEMCPAAVLAINVTHESLESEEWFNLLHSRLTQIENAAERLIIEITESQLPLNMAETANVISRIQAMGCRVALDDFGAGYTSFANLKDLHVDIVKVDGSFCHSLKDDPRNGEFLQAIQHIAASFNVQTVVEWVEDVEVAAQLKDWGFDCLQGGLYGMPMAFLPWAKIDIEEEKRSQEAG